MSYWDEIVSAALLGTARMPAIPQPAGDDAASALLAALDPADPEAFLLSAAVALPVHRRAGLVPALDTRPIPEACPPDDLPRLGERAARHMEHMLGGQRLDVFPEWLRAVAAAGKRVSEKMLPTLLDFGRARPEMRRAILGVLGERGRWLAAQDAKWDYWTGRNVDKAWQEGDVDARLTLLTWLREDDPNHARELLVSIWPKEEANERYKYLAKLEAGLSMADEPFLEETALDDDSRRVRQLTARLLSWLPESRLSKRMLQRADALLTYEIPPGQPSEQVTLHLPTHYDRTMERDGVVKKPKHHVRDIEEPAWWALQMLQVAPPGYWSQKWGASPGALVEAARLGFHRDIILEAWSFAAGQHRDGAWAAALLPRAIKQGDNTGLFGLMGALSVEQRETILMGMLQANRKPLRGSHPALMPLRLSPHVWSEELALEVLDNWRRYLERGNARPDPDMREALKGFAHYMPPSVYDYAKDVLTTESSGGRIWDNAVTEFLLLLQFRREMLEAIDE
ncbi:MAG: hypothetical protein JXB47_17915 [Anaerolineae bacterium]|nr:hypothetical protein [Anaerolineae bacterium]